MAGGFIFDRSWMNHEDFFAVEAVARRTLVRTRQDKALRDKMNAKSREEADPEAAARAKKRRRLLYNKQKELDNWTGGGGAGGAVSNDDDDGF